MELSLSNTNIGASAVAALVGALEAATATRAALKYLELDGTGLDDKAAKELARMIDSGALPKLDELSIENEDLSDQALMALVEATHGKDIELDLDEDLFV